MKIRVMVMALLSMIMAMLAFYYWPDGREGTRDIAPRERTRQVLAEQASPRNQSRYLGMMSRVPAGALKNRFVVILPGEKEYAAFSASMREKGLKVLARVDVLNALLVQADDAPAMELLAASIPEGAVLEHDFESLCPDLVELSLPDDLESWEAAFHARLGFPDDVNRGRGVQVAMLGFRVVPHPVLASASIFQYAAPQLGEGDSWYGTAMASVLLGRDEYVRGVAPSAQLKVFPVLSADGRGDSFSIAAAIVSAVDSGASLVCVLSSTQGYTALMLATVDYASKRNALVIAPASDAGGVHYPAALDGVLVVAGVDRKGRTLGRDSRAGIHAPGVGIPVAAPEGQVALVDGSGSSVMIVAGALAGLMYETPGLAPQPAAALLFEYASGTGLASGAAPGLLDVERVRMRNVPGLRDMAVTGIDSVPAGPGLRTVRVAVQNKGTAMTAFTLEVSSGARLFRFTNPGLPGNHREVFSFEAPDSGPIEARVSALANDINSENDVMIVGTE